MHSVLGQTMMESFCKLQLPTEVRFHLECDVPNMAIDASFAFLSTMNGKAQSCGVAIEWIQSVNERIQSITSGKNEKIPRATWGRGATGGRTYFAVNLVFGDVELSDHTERNSTTARLGIVHLTFEEDGINALFLGEDLGGASTGRTSTDDSDLVLHAEGGFRGRGGNTSQRLASEGRSREG